MWQTIPNAYICMYINLPVHYAEQRIAIAIHDQEMGGGDETVLVK